MTTRRIPLPKAILTFIAIWLGTSWLVVGAWLDPVLPGSWAIVAAGMAASAFSVWTLIRGLRGSTYPSRAIRLLVLRPFWYAMLFLPLLAAATLIGAIGGLPFGASGVTGRAAMELTAALLIVATMIGYAGARRLVRKRLDVRMPRLPSSLEGLRVVQLSDLHIGPHTSRPFLRRIVATVQNEHPDVIVITGDQVDDFARDVDYVTGALGGLEAPFGIFTIAGNHDVYAGWSAVRQGLAEAGYVVLVNEAIPIERDGGRLWLAGTGDPAGTLWPSEDARGAAPDLERTLTGIPPDEPVLALAHNPALWPELAARGVDLTLSGHTHYGQFAIPRRNWSMASPFLTLAMGSHQQGRSLLYIHPGTNYWGIPFRIGTPPEVTVLTLKAGRNGESSITGEPTTS